MFDFITFLRFDHLPEARRYRQKCDSPRRKNSHLNDVSAYSSLQSKLYVIGSLNASQLNGSSEGG